MKQLTLAGAICVVGCTLLAPTSAVAQWSAPTHVDVRTVSQSLVGDCSVNIGTSSQGGDVAIQVGTNHLDGSCSLTEEFSVSWTAPNGTPKKTCHWHDYVYNEGGYTGAATYDAGGSGDGPAGSYSQNTPPDDSGSLHGMGNEDISAPGATRTFTAAAYDDAWQSPPGYAFAYAGSRVYAD